MTDFQMLMLVVFFYFSVDRICDAFKEWNKQKKQKEPIDPRYLPPIHHNCRCYSTPVDLTVTKKWTEEEIKQMEKDFKAAHEN